MNPEPENFDQLRRLLKLKCHEAPPPRYFNDFSAQVISRIREESAVSHRPWVMRLWEAIERQPALTGLATAAACGLLVLGVIRADNTPVGFGISANGNASFESPGVFGQPEQTGLASVDETQPALLFGSSTNPAIQLPAGPSMFGVFPNLGMPQRVRAVNLAPE